jgi:hypothetical protein
LSNYGQQDTIGGDRINSGGVQPGMECEWPHDVFVAATHKLPVMRKIKGGGIIESGTFVYCCDEHLEIAEKSNPVRASKR